MRIPGPDERDNLWRDEHPICVPATTNLLTTGNSYPGYCMTVAEAIAEYTGNLTHQPKDKVCRLDPSSYQCTHYEEFNRPHCNVQCELDKAELGSVLDPTPTSSAILAAYYCATGNAEKCALNLFGSVPGIGKLKTAAKIGTEAERVAGRLALGLSRSAGEDLLFPFAKSIGAKTYNDFDIPSRSAEWVHFRQMIDQHVAEGGDLHVNLAGINGRWNSMTELEIHYICASAHLLSVTTWYNGAKPC